MAANGPGPAAERRQGAPQVATKSVGSPDSKAALAAALVESGHFDHAEIGQIMAQVEDESRFKIGSEDLRYSARRLQKVFGKYVRSPEEAARLVAAGPEAIANDVYGGRMGNAPAEGFRYRGRGYNQLTGKDNYQAVGKAIKKDLVNAPDLANDPYVAGLIVAEFYRQRKAEGLDLRTADGATRATNPRDRDKEARERAALAKKYDKQAIDELAKSGRRKQP